MTKRMLHENITTSDKFSKISFEAECLYCRLLTQTDDYGNVRGSVGYVKDVCFPRGKKTKIDYQMVGKWLAECQQVGLLLSYKVDDIEYLHFDRFEDFQTLRKDRLKNSSIPTYTKLRSNGWQVDNQMSAVCPHELELEVEVEEKEEDKYICVNFEIFWRKYPADSRRKKEECKKIYTDYCTNLEKEKEFELALSNYKQSSKYKDGYIQNSITWFRDWETWLDWEKQSKYEGRSLI